MKKSTIKNAIVPASNCIPAVTKALAVINLLVRHGGGMTRGELAAELELPPSTVYRILRSLAQSDYIRKGKGGRYDFSNGLELVASALEHRRHRFDGAGTLLRELADQVKFAVKLSVRRGADQVAWCCAASPMPIAVAGTAGAVYPIIEGSVGAALLADSSENQRRELCELCASRLPDGVDAKLLEERVRHVREFGCCFNPGLGRWGFGAFSVPVRTTSGEVVAALTLLGRADNFPVDRRLDWLAAVRRCAVRCAALDA